MIKDGVRYPKKTLKRSLNLGPIQIWRILFFPTQMVHLNWHSSVYYFKQACRPWGCRGCHGAPQILADQSTLSQPGGADYTHQITTGTSRFSDLATALLSM